MIDRSDAQVYFKQDIPLSNMDEYIDKKAQDGIRMSYMNIIYAGIVRIINERPKLNRFVMNGTTYQRDTIYVSLSIKKSLTDDGQETVVKIPFKGTETILEIKEKVDATIEKNKDVQTANKTDNLVKILNLVPNFLILFSVKMLKFLDKHGIMPKAVIKASPFHTSVFLTNVGSLGIDSIYHHIYNFGTTSLFFSMGKKKKSYIYEEDEIKEEKCITIAFVGDERICDGHYYATSFKQLNKYLKRPELLEKPPKNIENNKDLQNLIESIVIDGKIISFNLSNPIINLGVIFGILSKRDNKVSISNRLYEQYIYDYLSSKIEVSNNVLEKYNFKSDFIEGNGLNIEKILLRFQQFMKEQYSKKDAGAALATSSRRDTAGGGLAALYQQRCMDSTEI